MKRLGISLLVLGEILYWCAVLDPLIGLGVLAVIAGGVLLVMERVQ